MVGIEPAVLQRLKMLALHAQILVGLVNTGKQQRVERHELVTSMRHVDRGYFQIVSLVFAHQPLQRHRVPDNLSLAYRAQILDGCLHIVLGNGIVTPTVVLHQMMTEAALMYNSFLT